MGASITELSKQSPPTPVGVAQAVTAIDLSTPTSTQNQLRASLRRALTAVATPDQLRAIMVRLVDECKMGNMGAMRILSDLFIGRPELEPNDPNKTRMLTPAEVDEALRGMGYERKL